MHYPKSRRGVGSGMERWIYLPVNDLRWNDLCTKDATGTCAMCDTLAERDRFERRWFKGGVFVEIKNAVAPSVNKGWRWLRGHGSLAFLTVVSLGFLVPLIYAWWLQLDQRDQSLTCQVGFRPLQEHNGYLEIQLTEHSPSEPVFSGKLFFISVDPSNTGGIRSDRYAITEKKLCKEYLYGQHDLG
jgi:hypothetical protein